ncbi:MAG: OmpA family protein [Campylobacterota bacterium]
MNRFFLIILLSLSLYAEQKNVDYVNEITFLAGNSENGFTQNVGRSLAYGLQFQYNGLDFPIKPEIEFVYSQDISLYAHTEAQDTRYSSIMANGVYEIAYSELITPYVKAGLGYTSYANIPGSPSSSAYLDTGAGVKLHLTDRLALKFQVLTQFNTEEFNLVAAGGISFAFGRKYVAPPPEKTCEPCPEKVCEPCPVVAPVVIMKKELKPLYIDFVFAKSNLTDVSTESIKKYSHELNSADNIDKHILIVGHTDSKGPRSFNATLALKRAVAVRERFIANGVDPARISIDGQGEVTPTATNDTADGREKNRRVVVIVQER